ncbi:MAG: phosphatidylglycerol lysyltransferase domain-containing protein, partial [Bacillota bacterium]
MSAQYLVYREASILFERSSNEIQLGRWTFHEIELKDISMYSEYIKATEYPANLWSSNFAYLWASSQSSLRKVLWKIVDDMLVTFGHSYKNTLYLFCLPFGKGSPGQVMNVLDNCLKYCYNWNNHEKHRTLVRMINDCQLGYLRSCPEFDNLYQLVTLQGIERHFAIEKLTALTGKNFHNVRSRVKKFYRENQDVIVRRYRADDYEDLIRLGDHWESAAARRNIVVFDKVYYRELIKHCAELEQIILVFQKGHQIVGMVSGGELPTGQTWGSLIKYEEGITGLS